MDSNSTSALSPSSASQAYLSSLDFFSLAGLERTPEHGQGHDFDIDSHSLSPGGASGSASAPSKEPFQSTSQSHSATPGQAEGSQQKQAPYSPLDDPSPIALDVISRTPSERGLPRIASTNASAAHTRTNSQVVDAAMDVDHAASGSNPAGEQRQPQQQQQQHQHSDQHSQHHGHESGHNTPALDPHDFMNMSSGAGYDAVQASILQHQLESIHMQSPFVAATNPSSPYGAMAQMFLTSPPAQHGTSLPESSSQGGSSSEERGRQMLQQYRNSMGGYGVLTPGPSGDLMPSEMRYDLMSPMQLSAMMEGKENFNTVPLLSPALSHHASSSYASPVAQAAFGSDPQRAALANQAALEQLQLQQRQFQEQLALLQEQQRKLQATAAAVAAASGSPYLSAQQPQSSQGSGSQQHLTPGGGNGGAQSTPSPGASYFSPLTSPALEPAVSRSAALRAAAAHLSPALHSQAQRPPHPLSALSSPALNPVGSSGGANQTLSPALGPQNPGDMDSDYLTALQGILDGNSSSAEASAASGGYHSSPVIVPSTGGHSSPAVGPSSAGPHRSMPSKTRPSPMMKPTNHRSHVRGSSSVSVPTSPMAFKMSGAGFLPPAAIDNRAVQSQTLGGNASTTSSTPSPVDLAQIMPPPPVPSQGRPKMPMTPASLMNLAKEEARAQSQTQQAPQAEPESSALPPRAAAKKATSALAPASKRGSRLVPASGSTAAKRALAIRPLGVGVRAATKGAAAAAGANEPETRRTSHKAAEQKRRDSLKAGFDELRLLLPPINTEALDPESGEPIPGSSAPRLLPKSSLVPDDNPNRGVSKVALLKFSNEYIVRLHDKVNKRDEYIDKLRAEVQRLRLGDGEEVRGDEGEDLLEMDMLEGEEDDLGSDEDDDDMDVDAAVAALTATKKKVTKPSQSPRLGPTGPTARRRSSAAKKKVET